MLGENQLLHRTDSVFLFSLRGFPESESGIYPSARKLLAAVPVTLRDGAHSAAAPSVSG